MKHHLPNLDWFHMARLINKKIFFKNTTKNQVFNSRNLNEKSYYYYFFFKFLIFLTGRVVYFLKIIWVRINILIIKPHLKEKNIWNSYIQGIVFKNTWTWTKSEYIWRIIFVVCRTEVTYINNSKNSKACFYMLKSIALPMIMDNFT